MLKSTRRSVDSVSGDAVGRICAARISRCRKHRGCWTRFLRRWSTVLALPGLPVTQYSDDDLMFIWYGIGLHLGTPVSQSHAGLRMKVIRDEGATVGEV